MRGLLGPTTRWQPNDLIDMLYLACAAVYADGVAAERTATISERRGGWTGALSRGAGSTRTRIATTDLGLERSRSFGKRVAAAPAL